MKFTYTLGVERQTKNTVAPPVRPHLTRRELECLWLLAEGEQLKRIGFLLGLTTKTVEHYIGAARRKLGARTTAQAVAIAVARSIFDSTLPEDRRPNGGSTEP